MKTQEIAERGKIEEVLRNRILFIGNEIPDAFTRDNRIKQIYAGYPEELIDELTELFAQADKRIREDEKQKFLKIIGEDELVSNYKGKFARDKDLRKIAQNELRKELRQALTKSEGNPDEKV